MNISETIHSINLLDNELQNISLIELTINSTDKNVNKITLLGEDLLLPTEVIKGLLTEHHKRVTETRINLLNHLKGLLS